MWLKRACFKLGDPRAARLLAQGPWAESSADTRESGVLLWGGRAGSGSLKSTPGNMYYKFSSFTQKLTGAWASDAYNPQVREAPRRFGREKWRPESAPGSLSAGARRGFCPRFGLVGPSPLVTHLPWPWRLLIL